jgi:hypothetical protein
MINVTVVIVLIAVLALILYIDRDNL